MTNRKLWKRALSWRKMDQLILGLICFLLLLALMITLSFVEGLRIFIKDKTVTDLNSRRFLVGREVPAKTDALVDLQKISSKNPEISSIVPATAEKIFISATVVNKDFQMRLYGVSPGESPGIIEGRDIQGKESREILVPDILYFPDGSKIRGGELLGKSLEGRYEIRDYEPEFKENKNAKIIERKKIQFTVVGVYQSRGNLLEGEEGKISLLYGASKVIEQLNKESENNLPLFKNSRSHYLVTVKSSNNLEKMILFLDSKGYDLVVRMRKMNYATIALLTSLFVALTALFFGFSLLVMVTLQKSFLRRRMMEMGLLRIQGYSAKRIRHLLWMNLLPIFAVAFVGATLFARIVTGKIGKFLFWNNRIGNLGGVTACCCLGVVLVMVFLIIRGTLNKAYSQSPAMMIKEVE